jgi:hypothetical protein
MKTAVEWYTKQILEYKSPANINGTDYILIPVNKVDFLQEQAKEMEDQQKVEFALRAYIEKLSPGKDFIEIVNSMRTFKQNNNESK